jgi:predicted secreted protein
MGALQAHADTTAPPQNLASLTASATVEVDKDWLSIVFSTTREAGDGAAVQSQLRQALESALAEAKKVAKPGQVEVQTGAFSLMPRYTPKGAISGWQGTAELVVQGRDMAAISQLTGRIQTLTINRVAFSLSREARAKVEGEVTAEAIARFRAKADAVSRQFGFSGYAVREVSVSAEGGNFAMAAAPAMRVQAMKVDEALPVEAGKATVTASVSGSVQMK